MKLTLITARLFMAEITTATNTYLYIEKCVRLLTYFCYLHAFLRNWLVSLVSMFDYRSQGPMFDPRASQSPKERYLPNKKCELDTE